MTIQAERVVGGLARARAIERLRRREAELRRRLEREEAEVVELTRNEADEFLSQHPADLGTALELTEQAVGDRERVKRELEQVELALERAGSGLYGTCESCGRRSPTSVSRSSPTRRAAWSASARSSGRGG